LTIEEGARLKVIYGSADGFHAVDLDSASVYDIYLPKHVSIILKVNVIFILLTILLFIQMSRLKELLHHIALLYYQTPMDFNYYYVMITKVYM